MDIDVSSAATAGRVKFCKVRADDPDDTHKSLALAPPIWRLRELSTKSVVAQQIRRLSESAHCARRDTQTTCCGYLIC